MCFGCLISYSVTETKGENIASMFILVFAELQFVLT